MYGLWIFYLAMVPCLVLRTQLHILCSFWDEYVWWSWTSKSELKKTGGIPKEDTHTHTWNCKHPAFFFRDVWRNTWFSFVDMYSVFPCNDLDSSNWKERVVKFWLDVWRAPPHKNEGPHEGQIHERWKARLGTHTPLVSTKMEAERLDSLELVENYLQKKQKTFFS